MIYRAPAPRDTRRRRAGAGPGGRDAHDRGPNARSAQPSVVLGRSASGRRESADVNVSRRQRSCARAPRTGSSISIANENRGQRQAHGSGARARRRPHHDRLDRDRVRPLASVVMPALLALETDETLLILKIAFLVLLYGFIVLVVRSATKGMDQDTPGEHPPGTRRGRRPARGTGSPPHACSSSRTRSCRKARPSSCRLRSSSDAIRRVGSASTATSSHPRSTHGSSRERTARGSTTSARRTARLRERLEAEEGPDREGRRRDQDRRDRAAGAGVKIGRSTAVTDTGRRRMRNEDAFVFEAAVRDRGRHGRRPGR